MWPLCSMGIRSLLSLTKSHVDLLLDLKPSERDTKSKCVHKYAKDLYWERDFVEPGFWLFNWRRHQVKAGVVRAFERGSRLLFLKRSASSRDEEQAGQYNVQYIRDDINRKKMFSFGHCPNHLNPPPLTPIQATWSFFSDVEIQDLKVTKGRGGRYIINLKNS